MTDDVSDDDFHEIGRRLSLEGFLVDFMGGVMPGVMFLLVLLLVLFSPLIALSAALTNGKIPSFFGMLRKLLITLQDTPSAFWLFLLILISITSYILGHLFYRKDPKDADRASFRRLREEFEKGAGRDMNLSSRDDWCSANLACNTEAECEFPYPHFGKYLQQRGLAHLASLVVWDADAKRQHRSKTYVNILKERLHFHFPSRCGTIIRNEAHVRLASSTWYACGMQQMLSWWGIFICLVAYGVAYLQLPALHIVNLGMILPFILWPILGVITSRYGRRLIEKFLHYQRLREIFFVLETAFIASKKSPYILQEPFSQSSPNDPTSGEDIVD